MSLPQLMQESNTHARAGRYADAVACLEEAAALAPDHPGVWTSLGMLRSATGDLPGSEAALRRASELDERNVESRMCLGALLSTQQKTSEADSLFREALTIAPARADVSHMYSRVLADTARTEEALAVIRAAQAHNPGDISLQDKVCCLLNYLSGPSPEEVFGEHVKFGSMVGSPPPMHRITNRDPNRRLRIAYLSGDLREHSVAYFLEPLLEHHDRTHFEVWCLAVGPPDEKASPRLRSKTDQWRQVFPSTDDVLCRAIADSNIDILIELAGHAQGNRLTAVARAAAAVTISYLGYPNTTGVPAVGYRFIDAHTDPDGSDRFATERLIRFNDCFLCYRPYDNAPDIVPRPPGPITFGSFNNLAKLSNATLDLYGLVLAAVPDSRLILKGRGLGDSSVRTRVLSRLSAFNITDNRVHLTGHTQTTPDHLAMYHSMDIALDPFPYHGTTTTCEAMWMGIPVITLAGFVHASRVGISLLNAVGLPEFIAHSEADYTRIAADLATNPIRLAELRATLRTRLKQSPVCDAPAFTRSFESACRDAWKDWCSPTPTPTSPPASSTPSPPQNPVQQASPRPGILGRFFGRRTP